LTMKREPIGCERLTMELETEVTLADRGNSISWGLALGEFKTTTVLRINEKGEWTELGALVICDGPPQKMTDLKVRHPG